MCDNRKSELCIAEDIFAENSEKSLFANRIYQFAVYSDILKPDSPFITFNCADYYNNPQLLLSQLFGHKKGSFTGAGEDKAGLVEQADFSQ
ncbi:hypothetical protein DT075_15530 [Bacillus licheniformis]|nr:hypothetical protein DT075_15530 [Bacillus licheniformis]